MCCFVIFQLLCNNFRSVYAAFLRPFFQHTFEGLNDNSQASSCLHYPSRKALRNLLDTTPWSGFIESLLLLQLTLLSLLSMLVEISQHSRAYDAAPEDSFVNKPAPALFYRFAFENSSLKPFLSARMSG